MSIFKNIRDLLAFISVVLGFFIALLDTTIVSITLPAMTKFYHADVSLISWVVSGYNLAFAVCLIAASRIADQFGLKPQEASPGNFSEQFHQTVNASRERSGRLIFKGPAQPALQFRLHQGADVGR